MNVLRAVLLAILGSGLAAAAPQPPVALKLPLLFTDHRVLHRDMPIPVWGEVAQ